MALKSVHENLSYLQRHFTAVIAVAALFFLIIVVRLYELQILRGDDFRAFAEKNTLKEVRIPAVRGVIWDRDGLAIVSNRASFHLVVIPQYVAHPERMSATLGELVGLPQTRLKELWSRASKAPSFYPYVIARDIGYDAMANIQVRQAIEDDPHTGLALGGIEILPYSLRYYPRGSLAANVLGYVREPSQKELKRLQHAVPQTYAAGDHVGAMGLERRWEALLRGYDGYHQKIVNAVGKEVQNGHIGVQLSSQPAVSGLKLVTTLDARLQQFAEQLFEGRTGALVAMNPHDGEIYALVSQPNLNLSKLAGKLQASEWERLVNHPQQIFLNRPIQSSYPPGSTYKVVTATAALEEQVVTPTEKIHCPGYLKYGERRFRCWKKGGHGTVDFGKAIAESCDVYFYVMGIRLGVDRLAHYARRFGLGQKSGIDIAGENKGLVPTKAWKRQARSEMWYSGETLPVAIGQGYNLVTPLQNAVMISTVANGGYRVVPKISRFFVDVGGNRFPPPDRLLTDRKFKTKFSEQTLRLLQQALRRVIEDPRGTAHRLSDLPFSAAGKTGTAQVVGQHIKGHHRRFQDHALFVGYAPVDAPQIAVSVIIEHGGHGSTSAAPVAGAVINKFMELKAADKEISGHAQSS